MWQQETDPACGSPHDFSISVTKQIRIEPEWIHQANNQLADYPSHIVDYDDWYLDSALLCTWSRCGGHTQLIVVITPSYCSSTRGSGTQEQKQSMLLLVIGTRKTIGFDHQ